MSNRQEDSHGEGAPEVLKLQITMSPAVGLVVMPEGSAVAVGCREPERDAAFEVALPSHDRTWVVRATANYDEPGWQIETVIDTEVADSAHCPDVVVGEHVGRDSCCALEREQRALQLSHACPMDVRRALGRALVLALAEEFSA